MEASDQDNPPAELPKGYHQGNQPDVYVTCPYFPEHVLRRSRMPYHLMKCQNNPNAPNLLACPFNYMHRVRPEDRQQHIILCEDRVNKKYSDKATPSYSKTVKHTCIPNSDTSSNKSINNKVPPETGESDWW